MSKVAIIGAGKGGRDRLDREFVIIARTGAYGAVGGSMEEVVWRGRANADAGVDLAWSELSNADRGPAIECARAMKQTRPKLARVAHFQELERRYIPGTDERLKGSDGFSEAKTH